MTYQVFLPYSKKGSDDHEMPFHWLCYSKSEKKLKGSFTFTNDVVDKGSNIFFDEEEDMQLFVLMWGEYL